MTAAGALLLPALLVQLNRTIGRPLGEIFFFLAMSFIVVQFVIEKVKTS